MPFHYSTLTNVLISFCAFSLSAMASAQGTTDRGGSSSTRQSCSLNTSPYIPQNQRERSYRDCVKNNMGSGADAQMEKNIENQKRFENQKKFLEKHPEYNSTLNK